MPRKIPSLISDASKVVDFIRNAKPFVEEVKRAFSRKVHAKNIPPCPGYFQREEDREIRNKLKSLYKSGDESCVKTLVLHGQTGYGKKYSAANLMNQLYTRSLRLRPRWNILWNTRHRPTILWTIHANNQTRLLESYCSLAGEIGLKEEARVAIQELSLLSRTSEGRQHQINLQSQCKQNAYDEALKQIYEKVMENLSRRRLWVLLIEDPSEDMSTRFWPQPGDRSFGSGLVIVTTQNPKLLAKEGGDYSLKKVGIGKMTNKDAVKLLANKSGIPLTGADKNSAEDLAVKVLKCVPQDIAEFAEFAREYKEETNKTITFKDFSATKAATGPECMLMLEMNRKDRAIPKLLKFLACCASENYLPLKILDNDLTEAAEAAKNRPFVNIEKLSERDETKVITMHQRYHSTLRNLLTRQEESVAEETWKDVFRQLFMGNGQFSINIPKLSGLVISQVIECLSGVCKDALQRCRDEDFTMLRFISPHMKEAVELSSKLTEGEIEPLILAEGHACLGVSLLFSGESEEATSQLKFALALYKSYKGEKNVQLDLANVLHFLGEAYSNSHLGNPSKGEMHLREALNLKEKFSLDNGKEDAQVAFTLRSLGNVLNELGKQSEAIGYIERALKIYDENYNIYKQEYGYTLSALGSSYRYLGQYVQAEDYLKKALDIFRSVDSPSKLRIGVTLSRLSSVQRNMDKLDESIISLKEAEQMFEYNDIYRAVILSKLSVVYRYKGDSKKSFEFAEEVKAISDKQHGTKDHPAIATALLNLGYAQTDLGDVEDAVRNLTKAMRIYEALHGKNHRIAAATLNYLGYAYQQMGMVQEGKKKLERAVGIMKQNYSPSHPEKANSLKRLSKACLILGETIKSAELACRALKIYKETYENTMEHREVRKCQVRVAYACSKIGLFDKAKEYLMEVELGFPKEKMAHPEFAALLQKKTEIILDSFEFKWPLDEKKVQEMLSKAKADLIKADQIVSNSLGCKHQRFAVTKKERARLNILMGNHKIAYDEIRLALNVIPNVCHHLKAEFSLIRSDAEKKLGLNTAQKESLERAENIYRNTFGDNHPMVAFTLHKLCTLNLDLDHLQNAYKYFEASEQACETLKTNLTEQRDSSNIDFLKNYSVDAHPIVKRQQVIEKRIRRNQGAW